MDIFEKFAKRARERSAGTDAEPQPRGLPAGFRSHYVEVIGPTERDERYAKRNYHVRCLAPSRENGAFCGNQFIESYARLYNNNAYSCGCIERHKHPPVRLEGKSFGRLSVTDWSVERGYWIAVCQECGAVMFFRRQKHIERQSTDCRQHAADSRFG